MQYEKSYREIIRRESPLRSSPPATPALIGQQLPDPTAGSVKKINFQ